MANLNRRRSVSYLTYFQPSSDPTPVACYIVPFDDVIRDPRYAKTLATILVDLGLSRRELAKLITAIICDYRFTFYWPGGKMRFLAYEEEVEWAFLDKRKRKNLRDDPVGRAFNNDGSFRWISDFISRAFLPITDRTQRLHEDVAARVRLITIAVMVVKPDEARKLFLIHP